MPLNVLFDDESAMYWLSRQNTYFSMQSLEQFLHYFFPSCFFESEAAENYTYLVHGIRWNGDLGIRKDVIHVIVCVENCPVHKNYEHYEKHGSYGNRHVKIYLYNHIDKIEETESYIAIPVIYAQVRYFQNACDSFWNKLTMIPFEEKKFCLFVSQNGFRKDVKQKIKTFLAQIGKCDSIEIYKPSIKNKSCYNSLELLNVFQQYKFVFVCENSLCPGYITEKIFNCFTNILK